MELYIVRHGETKWNSLGLLQGNTDIELDEKGRELAGQLGTELDYTHFDCIYSSPLIRAYETACLIRGHRNIPIIRDDRIREISFGTYEGKNAKELFENENDPFHYFFTRPELFQPAPGGESFEDVCKRAGEFMTQVIEPLSKTYTRVMITAHGAVNKALMHHVKQNAIKDYWDGGLQKNCGFILLSVEQNHYQIIKE